VVGALAAVAPLAAQQGAKEPQFTVLTPAAQAGVEHGRMATASGRAGAAVERYSVQDLDLMQPVAVTVIAADPGAPVRLEVVKGEWEKVFRTCDTDATGQCAVRFRTQGNFGVQVRSTSGAEAAYELGVWVGDEIHAVPANVLGPPVEKEGSSTLLLVIAGLLALILIALVALDVSKSRAGAAARAVALPAALAALVGAGVLAGPLAAQGVPGALLEWGKKVGEEVYKQNYNIQQLQHDFESLSPDDASQDASYPVPPGGSVPSHCSGEGAKACDECGYEAALEELQSTRYRLEKLRRVYASAKNMIAHSLAVGDSLAGAAGVGGLAWVSERKKILDSQKGLQASYDAKYEELMGLLRKSLEAIAQCEERVYGEKDWYPRFGFMYYEFMAARYQRAD
jgi:hypothetical protein